LTTHEGVVNYAYNEANRLVLSAVEGLTSVNGVAVTWNASGMLPLRKGVYPARARDPRIILEMRLAWQARTAE